MMPSTRTIGTAKPIRSVVLPDQAGHHRAEQRADVVELVEARDHRVHPGLAYGGLELHAVLRRARDPGGRREAQRRDHRDAGAEDREADHGHLPGGGEDHDREPAGADHRADPEDRDDAEPGDQPVAGDPDGAAREQVGQRRERDVPLRRREGVVEEERSPGLDAGVDHVEEHHRDADQDDRAPRHGDLGRELGRPVVAGQERPERHDQRDDADERGDLDAAAPPSPARSPAPITPPRVQAPWNDGRIGRP